MSDVAPTPGRKHVLDEASRREICALLAAGSTRAAAAHYVSCSRATLYNTAAKDPEFAEQIRRAEMAFEMEQLRNLQQAARKSWRAAAFSLQRLNPSRGTGRGDTVPIANVQRLVEAIVDVVSREVPLSSLRNQIVARIQTLSAKYVPNRTHRKPGRR